MGTRTGSRGAGKGVSSGSISSSGKGGGNGGSTSSSTTSSTKKTTKSSPKTTGRRSGNGVSSSSQQTTVKVSTPKTSTVNLSESVSFTSKIQSPTPSETSNTRVNQIGNTDQTTIKAENNLRTGVTRSTKFTTTSVIAPETNQNVKNNDVYQSQTGTMNLRVSKAERESGADPFKPSDIEAARDKGSWFVIASDAINSITQPIAQILSGTFTTEKDYPSDQPEPETEEGFEMITDPTDDPIEEEGVDEELIYNGAEFFGNEDDQEKKKESGATNYLLYIGAAAAALIGITLIAKRRVSA